MCTECSQNRLDLEGFRDAPMSQLTESRALAVKPNRPWGWLGMRIVGHRGPSPASLGSYSKKTLWRGEGQSEGVTVASLRPPSPLPEFLHGMLLILAGKGAFAAIENPNHFALHLPSRSFSALNSIVVL